MCNERSSIAGTAYTPYGRYVGVYFCDSHAVQSCVSVCVSRVIAVTKKIRCVRTLSCSLDN